MSLPRTGTGSLNIEKARMTEVMPTPSVPSRLGPHVEVGGGKDAAQEETGERGPQGELRHVAAEDVGQPPAIFLFADQEWTCSGVRCCRAMEPRGWGEGGRRKG